MTNNSPLNANEEFEKLLTFIQQKQLHVFQKINTALIDLYWELGEMLSEKVKNNEWGKSVVTEFAKYIVSNAPDVKGFSDKNLWRMKQFYETYADHPELSALLREIPWTHNMIIFSRCKSLEERIFYINNAIREKYSTRSLDRQINASLYERTQLGDEKLSSVMRELQPSAKQVFKNSYVLEFLGLPEEHTESDLQKELVKQIKKFIIELGRDFLFIDQEYKLQVGNSDFYIDLLFYHRELQCLVALELKTDKFKPEHLGQLNFYLEALDRDVRKSHENPSIGILLCRDKDEEVVEYALSRNLKPSMVAEYHLQLPDKKLLQEKLHQILGDKEKNVD